ncbi:rhodanese-like domain-containing protein [bacterium]|nr:rhodanese-like domain-containing protein [bacterium]
MGNKKWIYYPLIKICIAILVLTGGCIDLAEEHNSDAFETLTSYLSSNNMDLDDILSGWIIDAPTVHGSEDSYYIMDIRADTAFQRGHIPGAVNTTLGQVLEEAQNNLYGLPILVVCYTGQSAAHAVVALRLGGYPDAMSLKFGMSSWHGDFDKWSTNTGNIALGHSNWSTDPVENVQTFNYPGFITTAEDGDGILHERIAVMLADGFKGINAMDVLVFPASYFINNYWVQIDVNIYGHIIGAYRIKENLTIAADGFGNLDPDETIVTYCWTGQTSSFVTAYLTVLGFDAKSIKYGVNAMIYNDLTSNKWTGSYNYAYESGGAL